MMAGQSTLHSNPQVPGERSNNGTMRLSIGPIQYFWPRDQVERFYDRLSSHCPLSIYLGETVCSKRRELDRDAWLAIGRALAGHGHEVIVSTLSLIEAGSELGACRRLVENGEFTVEANDMSAVHYLVERKLPFVAGPGINLYNHLAVDYLRRNGMFRMVLPVEMGRAGLASLNEHAGDADMTLPEIELHAWGRLPLAWSARCFTARAVGRGKDQCGFECIHHPHGQLVNTREGQEFLNLNGVQVQSAAIQDLSSRVDELAACGVDLLRLYPQANGFDPIIERFESALAGHAVESAEGSVAGYWLGQPGIDSGSKRVS
ncbi:MAG: U32 family peptidase [Wenzhouxiangellaceae bacterium]|nr:U32 family peptidase [Wenzhouxiangellaceae bacterium]